MELLVGQIADLAARMPVLIVLEDAHWVDPTTHELFDILVERIRVLPVLLIITYRNGAAVRLGNGSVDDSQSQQIRRGELQRCRRQFRCRRQSRLRLLQRQTAATLLRSQERKRYPAAPSLQTTCIFLFAFPIFGTERGCG